MKQLYCELWNHLFSRVY